MHVLRSTPLIHRRHVLRGLGTALALPLLDCMRPARTAAAAAAAAAKPRRSVFIYLPNGVNNREWQILGDGRDYRFSPTLSVLEKHRDQITPISGLHHPHGLGNHHGCQTIWLTGGKIGETERNTISVDQMMADKMAPHTRFASLELSNQGRSLSWNNDGILLPAEANPGVVFRRLFAEPEGGLGAQRRRLDRRQSILDAVLGEATSLRGKLGTDDRGRLDQYLTSVREVEVRAQRAEKWLDVPRPQIDPAQASHLSQDVGLSRLGDYLRTMYDLIVLAFQTDTTRVVTFSTGEEGKGPAVPDIRVFQDRHSLSHHGGNETRLADLAASDRFNVQQLSYFLDRLREVRDADGPLLDTSMVLFGSGMAYGHSHGNSNLPLVLAGGSALGLKHGSHVDFNRAAGFTDYEKALVGICHSPVDAKARMSNLLMTMAQRMEVNVEQFGDSTRSLTEVES
jgi:hypothetical protein